VAPVLASTVQTNSSLPKYWLLAAAALVAVAAVIALRLRPAAPKQAATAAAVQPQKARSVSALGRLVPAGDVRKLAAPSGPMGAMPRIEALLVEEGDQVLPGQLLARFDSRVDALADQSVAKASISSLEQRKALLEQDLNRYRTLLKEGAVTQEGVEQRQLVMLQVDQELRKARAELQRQSVKLPFTELRAPFAGLVLQIHARPGERPGEKGVLELGRSDQMEAELEVYESDVGKVQQGQRVELRSENGGFDGVLTGRVKRLEPRVRQREVLSTDPSADTDARVVAVRVELNRENVARVKQLAGLKLIGKIKQ
jgi:HlyD family secretion protein